MFYFKQKKECDFIVFDRDKAVLAIQVCYDMSEADTRKRELKGFTEAMDYFLIEKGIIITSDQEEELEIDGKKIQIKPAYKVMLEEKSLV